ncbi:MOSC N-terminal beta barrel domain-containing protein [Devosia sediminis]|uniref:MOSC N-terminal beta barrel domain-containing protein n=1 Tax=Devosia sediminis TaxID=2798801 RepID=A0A934IUP4_9HYPH|nr:MOSC N-terminal beta barrel domain-containing protein [Devosia sediminis]
MAKFRIDQLQIYPVRSIGGMSVPRAQITPAGSLAGDREWVVVRPDGSLI